METPDGASKALNYVGGVPPLADQVLGPAPCTRKAVDWAECDGLPVGPLIGTPEGVEDELGAGVEKAFGEVGHGSSP